MAKTWRILSIDGGGIRGIIPAVLLEQIEYGTGKQIADLFDFVTGTSSGAITALTLTVPLNEGDNTNKTPRYRADDIIEFYFNEGPGIFPKRPIAAIEEWALGGPKYHVGGLKKSLNKYLGSAKLRDALTNVMIPTYCLELRMPIFFKSWNTSNDGQYLMKELARASSAAPTFFVPEQLNTAFGKLGFVDGGLVSNNPTMTALVECMRYAEPGDKFWILSLGTGRSERSYKYSKAVSWRPIDWIRPVIEICMDGSDAKTDYELLQLSRLPELTYYRFDTILPDESAPIDKASLSNMDNLKMLGERIFQTEMRDKFESMLLDLINSDEEFRATIQWKELSSELQPFAQTANFNPTGTIGFTEKQSEVSA